MSWGAAESWRESEKRTHEINQQVNDHSTPAQYIAAQRKVETKLGDMAQVVRQLQKKTQALLAQSGKQQVIVAQLQEYAMNHANSGSKKSVRKIAGRVGDWMAGGKELAWLGASAQTSRRRRTHWRGRSYGVGNHVF